MNYSIESIIEQAEQRDHNFAEICRALDELDTSTLERVLVYAVQRREAFNHGDPRTRFAAEALPDLEKAKNIVCEAEALTGTTRRAIARVMARAEKAVRTRNLKRNAKARKANAKRPRREDLSHQVAEVLRSDPKAGVTAKDIASATKIRLGTVYTYLKAIGAYSNGKGRWWIDKKAYLANFPIAGKKKKAANRAATSP
jgi:DNA-binding NarL/FixJ family response regulator